MSVAQLTESVVEEAALAWLESVGWWVRSGAEIALGEKRGRNGKRLIGRAF